MGPEVFYYGSGEFKCPNCDESIEVEYEASKYPVGAFNDSETNASGGYILEGFGDIDIQFDQEIYSFDEEFQLYIPQQKEIVTTSGSAGGCDLTFK